MAHKLLVVKIGARSNQATKVQEVLTQHGCSIRTRLGLHETSPNYCAEDGLVILELADNQEDIQALRNDLEKLSGVTAQYLEL
ncbi:MAG TPA: hypothetical protein DCY12_02780 [Candidatus Atribacteria bacterium]|uniref:Uncharacterized protein n=1 Tax=Atribacter laminatus TaxID=2847778 RepID=A0A7T1F304_ATRLM|nr:hypothetical protein [Atribacter laminatus]QPM68297.1 hypothetical protein RT761_01515 [Atribacter laminatus]HAX97829.1 hypothetical protein [Candidatus Atribacteria bacterium]